MSDTVIKVENVGKKYRIGANGAGTDGLRHVIHDLVTAPIRALRRNGHASTQDSALSTQDFSSEDFWALRDVSFEVKRGEVVGIIGRNGAGKSTLLKILSRITEPTTGRLGIKGRVASLLEVGTGFHPELTGRENIFLNGAILGMSREEIKRKFDEIVAFAEIEKFIDTPVKRYSSGMYVRLAFAVAAHLEPEILIVDEVLAVGDAGFQKKCLGKMEQVGKDGRTVLFVSHNMSAVEMLCTKVAQLRSGRLHSQGEPTDEIRDYLGSIQHESVNASRREVPLGPNLTLTECSFQPNPVVAHGRQQFSLQIASRAPDRINSLVLLLYSTQGHRVAVLDLRQLGNPLLQENDALLITGQIESLPLVEGDYHIGLYIESTQATGNFMYLTEVSVTTGRPTAGIMPYPAHVRGFVELNFATQMTQSTSVSAAEGVEAK